MAIIKNVKKGDLILIRYDHPERFEIYLIGNPTGKKFHSLRVANIPIRRIRGFAGPEFEVKAMMMKPEDQVRIKINIEFEKEGEGV